MPVCRRCVMPAIPGLIDLDDDGVCTNCRDHRSFSMQNEEALRRLEKEDRIDRAIVEFIFRQLNMDMPGRLISYCETGAERTCHAAEEENHV